MSSSFFDSSNASMQLLQEKAKQDLWDLLPEEQRQSLCYQVASKLPINTSTQSSTVHQTPRTVPPTTDMMHFSTPNFGNMDRTLSASSFAQSAMDANTTWNSTNQDGLAEYTFSSEASTRRPSALQSIPEASMCSSDGLIEYNPVDYVVNYIEPSSSGFPSSLSQQHLQLTSPLAWSSSSDSSTSPSTPSTALTPVTHASNPMSRQNSYNPHFLDSTAMLRIQSDSSCLIPFPSGDGEFPLSLNTCVDGSLFPPFTDSVSENFLSSAHTLSASAAQAFASSENDKSYLGEDMRRSTSASSSVGNASDASAPSSTCTRQSRREREINALASRKIAPKADACIDEIESLPSNVQMARIRSEDGSSKTVGVIAKTPYMRPKHPKIMCQFCNDRPQGFRGTHELDRHISRAHAPSRKGYICVDYSSDGKFLANCKHCRNKKVYGAYYNAAAHLRRAHFHPRKRGRKGKNDEKRGGIGGGDDPPMDYLKMHWIKEVGVDNKPPKSPSVSDDDSPELADASYDDEYEPEPYSTQQPMQASLTPQVPIDTSQYMQYGMSTMHASEPVMYDANTSTAYNHNMAAPNDFSSFQFDAYMTQ